VRCGSRIELTGFGDPRMHLGGRARPSREPRQRC
jgi:hypothetical protein